VRFAPAAALAWTLVPSSVTSPSRTRPAAAQLQRGHQQPGQGVFVADPEPGDGHVIRCGVAGKDPEGEVFVAAAFDLAGGADPGAVRIQQHRQQHPGLIGGPAVPIGPIRDQEPIKIQLVNHVEDEPGQVVGRHPVAQVGWEQKGLVAVASKEAISHGRSYATGVLCYLHYGSQQPLRNTLVRVNAER
jgi:hypothetical protein